jgi:hypothetical protein
MPSLATRAAMSWLEFSKWRPLEALTRDPGAAQAGVLRQLLRANQDTTFGRAYDFSRLVSPRDYQTALPVQRYDDLAPHIEAQRTTSAPALTAEPPLFYAQTSGTTGTPKYVPVTRTMLHLFRDEQATFSYLQYRACPAAFDGAAFGVMGAATEGRLDSGHAVGSVSGQLYAALPGLLRRRLVVPPEVAEIEDYEQRYDVTLLLALASPRVTYMGSPNPSTFVRLLQRLAARKPLLLDLLASGRADAILSGLPSKIRATVAARVTAQPARARQLDALPAIGYGDLWPGLALVTTWTGGSCGIPLGALRTQLPPAATVMELGYQATEFRGTLPLEAGSPGGLPPLHHHYFEFADRDEWDLGRTSTLTLSELSEGSQYYVIITTAAGLYRYFMNDLVEVTGWLHRTPLLRFVQKGRGVTNITGEKLYEGQVIAAVDAACGAVGLVPRFYVVTADEATAGYRAYIEPDSDPEFDAAALGLAIDRRLSALNIEYDAKRKSGRLSPLQCLPLATGTADAYRDACVRAGQRDGQLKPPALAYTRQLALDLGAYALEADRTPS